MDLGFLKSFLIVSSNFTKITIIYKVQQAMGVFLYNVFQGVITMYGL